jgi:hypothetical protein
LVPKGKSVYISIWIKRMSATTDFLPTLLLQALEAVTATQAAAAAANAAAAAANAAAATAQANARAVKELLTQQQQQTAVRRSSSFERHRQPRGPCKDGDGCSRFDCWYQHSKGKQRHGLTRDSPPKTLPTTPPSDDLGAMSLASLRSG